MAKLEIPIRVYMGELEEIINELKHLQTYKLFDGDDKVLIDRDEVVKTFADHLRTEILSDSTIAPERKNGKWTLLPNGDAICQECKHIQKSAWDVDGWDNFCHHCGADMRGEEE